MTLPVPIPASSKPAQLGPGELLAALHAVGELPPGRVAELLAAMGVPMLPLFEPRPDGTCTCPKGAGCKEAGKHPRIAGGVHAASADPAQVHTWWERWPDANPAARTGVRFDACDVDRPDGVEALRALFDQVGYEHCGPLARTGSGGWHLLFAPTGLGNRTRWAPGLDWRGQGGYVAIPPARHASGRHYAWVRPLAGELPGVPAVLRERLIPPTVQRATLPPPGVDRMDGSIRGQRYALAALERETDRVRAAGPGEHNAALNRAAFNVGQLVHEGLLDDGQARATLLGAIAALGCPRCTPREAGATISSGLAGAKRKPRRLGRLGGVA